MSRIVLDLIPPGALALVSLSLGATLLPQRATLRRPRLALACVVAPACYALGTALYLIGERWPPGAALASLGVLLVLVAFVGALHPGRPWVGGAWAALGCAVWLASWKTNSDSIQMDASEPPRLLIYAAYTACSLACMAWGLRSEREDLGLARRLVAVAAPLLGIGAAIAALQAWAILPRGPALPALTLVACELTLYLLVKESGVATDKPASWLGQGLVLLLVGIGALVAFGLAANLRLLPRAPGAVLISAAIGVGLAFAYGAFLPGLQAVLEEALYPETRAAKARAARLAAELEETRGRLQRAEQRVLVGELAAQVAHEIKNPLGPIKGYAAVIEREAERAGALSEKLARGLEVIRAEVETIDARAQALLELARAEGGGSAIWSTEDLVSLIEDELERGRGAFPAVSWELRAPREGARFPCDPLLFRSALGNLLQNAAQAGAGKVEVALSAEPEEWVLRVTDDGPGLPSEASELLKPFVTKRAGGTGLGLSIARGSARALGGELRLGPGPEGGARAEIRLPRVSAAAPSAPNPELGGEG